MSQQNKLDDYMGELKRAAKIIDNADTPLEEAIAAYQKGAEAYRNCMALIDEAEQKINVITKSLQEETND